MVLETSVIITIIVSVSGVVGLVSRLLFASKCDVCKCWGIEIHRNTNQERQTAGTPQINPIQNV